MKIISLAPECCDGRKIKKGDRVVILTGRDKAVLEMSCSPAKRERAIVRGINTVQRHQKQTATEAGSSLRKPRSICRISRSPSQEWQPTRWDSRYWMTAARSVSRSAPEN